MFRGVANPVAPRLVRLNSPQALHYAPLAHSFHARSRRPRAIAYGGLAMWQQKRVADYVEEHLADAIPIALMAGLVRLSPFHFARAFRQSFGLPPHRYHIGRRIERAKSMLANSALSITEIGLRLGFSEISAFTATFRKFTGRTPTGFRRAPG